MDCKFKFGGAQNQNFTIVDNAADALPINPANIFRNCDQKIGSTWVSVSDTGLITYQIDATITVDTVMNVQRYGSNFDNCFWRVLAVFLGSALDLCFIALDPSTHVPACVAPRRTHGHASGVNWRLRFGGAICTRSIGSRPYVPTRHAPSSSSFPSPAPKCHPLAVDADPNIPDHHTARPSALLCAGVDVQVPVGSSRVPAVQRRRHP